MMFDEGSRVYFYSVDLNINLFLLHFSWTKHILLGNLEPA